MKRAGPFLLLLCLTACHEAGTWQDAPKNFRRVFRVSQPQDVAVVHSWFWRSPHWTYEFAYFMQIAPNDRFAKSLFEHNKLKKLAVTGSETNKAINFVHQKPGWFIPKPLDCYEAWMYAEEPHGDFRIFTDPITKDLFLSDHQL